MLVDDVLHLPRPCMNRCEPSVDLGTFSEPLQGWLHIPYLSHNVTIRVEMFLG
jgi:hypothetical protein